MIKNLSFTLFFLLVAFAACKKQSPAGADLSSLKANLTSHLWKISGTLMSTASGERPQTIPNCRKDNLWEYKSDGSFALYAGAILCSPTETTIFGTWELVNSGKELKITIPNVGSYIDEIKILQSDKLQLRYTTNNVYTDTYISN